MTDFKAFLLDSDSWILTPGFWLLLKHRHEKIAKTPLLSGD